MVTVNKNMDNYGLNRDGRMVAFFGTPVIDGKIDEIWSNAQVVTPRYISGSTDTTASFKALWDDNALYILAVVKDNELTAKSEFPPLQDSVEIFLDENNDKEHEYGVDDLHFRVNFENKQTVDIGNPERFYSCTSLTEDGYIVEARIALQSKPSNGKVLGFELQINDAKGTDRAATLNIFDSTGTAWIDTGKFGEIVLTGKSSTAVSGLNPYDLLGLINTCSNIKAELYKNFELVTDAIKSARILLADKNISQKQIDEEYKKLKEAVSKLVLTDEAANEKLFRPLPVEYRSLCSKPGSIERMEYYADNLNGGKDLKKLNVYLPYGYNPADKSRKYNVLYLMHGGGENEDLLFGGPGENKELKKIIDNMIENGDIEPLIVVTPSFYGGKNDIKYFPEELLNTIIPMVESKYNTYLASSSQADIKASRENRAFGGFSMGGATTWYCFINCLDYIKYFVPLSGDCWIMDTLGGGKYPEETAQFLAHVAKESGYKPHDYYLLCASGDRDIAFVNLYPQVEEMKKFTDEFIYSSDLKKGNFYFLVCDGGTHAWNWINQYIYDILPDLFK